MTRRGRLVPAVALLCTACSVAGSSEPTEHPLPAPVLVQVSPLQQSRSDSDRRVATLPVRNGGPATVRITSVQLQSSRFAPLPAVARDDPMTPGDRLDLRVPYGATRCQPGPPGEAVVVGVRTADGQAASQRFPLPPPVQGLDRAHEVDCLQQRYEQAFAPRLVATGPPGVRAGRPTLPARLTFTRVRSRESVVVIALSGSRLYDLVAAAPPAGDVLALAADRAEATADVRLVLPECEAHVVSQVNLAFAFSFSARVGRGPVETVALPSSEELTRQLALLPPLCGTG